MQLDTVHMGLGRDRGPEPLASRACTSRGRGAAARRGTRFTVQHGGMLAPPCRAEASPQGHCAGHNHAWPTTHLSPRLSHAAHKHVCPASRRQQHVRHPPWDLRQRGGQGCGERRTAPLRTRYLSCSGSSSGGRAPHLHEPDAILAQQRQLAGGRCSARALRRFQSEVDKAIVGCSEQGGEGPRMV